jgi:hypothetical protein
MSDNICLVKPGAFGRWYIFHAEIATLAWSGQQWVRCHRNGFPAGQVQTCNFEDQISATRYVTENMEQIRDGKVSNESTGG